MFDINLLPKDVRAKKQKEVARIKASAPKGVSLEKGQKIRTKIVSVNFFGKMWERLARKKKPMQETVIAEKSVLQTPHAEATPSAPPEVPPYPLRPVQVMPMTPVKKPEEKIVTSPKKTVTNVSSRAEDGVVLPDISSLIQSTEKEKLAAPILRHVPVAPPEERTPSPTRPVIVPPPQIKKEKSKTEIAPEPPKVVLPQSAHLGNEPKEAMAVMPRRQAVQLPPSPLMAGIGGLLILLAAGSFLGGSYAILQRLVTDLERVQTAYQSRIESAGQILQDVSAPVKEMEITMKESSLLYAAYQQWDADQGRAGELTQQLLPVLDPFLTQPFIQYANGIITIQGKAKNKATADQVLEALKGNATPTPQSVFTKETFGDNLLIQFSIPL